MPGTRSALIVATYLHEDPGLTRLRAPARDAEELAEVLSDPDIGGFDVVSVINGRCHEVSRAVATFFKDRKPDDLLMLHFSGHGLKDDSGELFFAATDTRLDLLEATAVPSSFVSRTMDRSRAGRVVLLLDCCYSGAFARGLVPRAVGAVDVNERLGGRGRAVITASSALQFAFEGDELADGALDADGPSAFTSALVRGLRTGEADRDLDGWVSLDELYAFVHDEVTRISPQQTPKKWAFDIEGDVYVARRGAPVTSPSDLPPEIEGSMQSLLTWEREAAAVPLSDLLSGDHPGLALAARLALERMAAEDDSERVRAAARAALGGMPPEPAPKPVLDGTGPQPPTSEPPGPSRRWVLGAAGLAVAAIAAGAVVWLLPPGADDGGGGGGGESVARLPETEVLVTRDLDAGGRELLAVDVVSGATKVLSTEPTYGLPTISPDRTQVALLVGTAGAARPAYLVEADGSGLRQLLDAEARRDCPFAARPAWSPDGSQLVVLCQDADQQTTGMSVVEVDGSLVRRLVPPPGAVGAPTWGADGRIYVECAAENPDDPSTIRSVAADGSPGSLPLLASTDGSDSHPDWTVGGVLFLRSSSPSADAGDVWFAVPGEEPKSFAGEALVKSPTSSPDGESAVWLQPSPDDAKQSELWVDVAGEEGAHGLGVVGRLGPPAWGSR
ncbi:caspase, EACC1-associated type [Nocardioides sp.]|uniref:caspase, EACC1-associated type n=1 Tax=Nocardioides sp. TaxID=35761 RepID=UPI003D0A5428